MDQHHEKHDQHFSLTRLYDLFSICKEDNGSIDVDEYVNAFEELSKMFKLFGTVFGFVSSDVLDKLEILRAYRKSPETEKYKTVQSMIQYEIEHEITKKNKKSSGSRTLLRLHRAMEFTAQIMEDIKDSDEHGKMAHITAHAYDKTLAKHHPWLIRKAVHLAVYTLPKREHLLEKMKLHDEKEAVENLGKAVNIQRELFDIIEQIYAEDNLLHLP